MDTSFSASAKPRAASWLPLTLGLALCLSSCRTAPHNPFFENEQSVARAGSVLGEAIATEPLDATLLADDDWYEEPPKSYAQRKVDHRRWRHPQLDAYLHPETPQSDLTASLEGDDATSAANAAIVLAYWQTGRPTETLVAAIRAERLPLPLRCAAVEALGRVERPSPAPALRRLLSEYTVSRLDVGDAKPVLGKVPDLHADLIRALARHAEATDEKWFIAAAKNEAWQVRLEGVAAWSTLVDWRLPAEAVELRADRDPRVRAVTLRTIAAHGDPRSVKYLQAGLDDEDDNVRLAAMAGLRELGTAEALALVGRAQDRDAQMQQASDLASQAARGMRDDLQASAADAQAELRSAVADRLANAQAQGQQIATDVQAGAEGYVRQASAQARQTVDDARAVADTAAARMREVEQLAASLREADLPEKARRQAAETLVQMADDAEIEVRIRAARAMGELADPMFLPALVALLNDAAEVRRAAMTSLALVAGGDITVSEGKPLSEEERAHLWQLWYARQQSSAHAH